MDGIEMISMRTQGRAPTMPGQFPNFFDVPAGQRSGSRMSISSDTESSYSHYGPPSQVAHPPPPHPPRGILKNSPNRQNQERLAARFYRVPRSVQTHQTMQSPLPSPTYYGSDSSCVGYDGETDITSSASELSVNTQATSVASSDLTDRKSYRPVLHIRHVRPVPLPVARVKTRPRTRAPSEVSKSETTGSRSRSSGKRTVHIQIIPNKVALPPTESMQVARIPNGDLMHRLEQLESDTEGLQLARRQLSRKLGDTSQQLSLKVHENQEMVRALRQERSNNEVIMRDLEEQRKLFDGFRNDYEWQHSMLQEVERERDRLKQAYNNSEQKLLTLERDMSDLEQETADHRHRQRDQDGDLQVRITQLETTTTTLENKLMAGDERIRGLLAERDELKAQVNYYQEQMKAWKKLKTPMQKEKRVAEEARLKLQSDLDVSMGEKEGLQAKITGFEAKIATLEAQITEFETTRTTLETSLASEKTSKDDLEKKLSSDKAELEKQLLAEKDELQKQLLAEKDELQKQLLAEKEALAQQHEAAKADLEQRLQSTSGDLGKQLEDVKSELGQQLEQSKAELEKQLGMHKAERDDLQQKIDAVSAARGELEKQLETAKNDVSTAMATRDEIEQRGAAWQAEKDARQSTIDNLTTELDGAKDANIALVTERIEAEKQLTDARASLAVAQDELAGLQAAQKTLQTDHEELQARAADLDKQHAEKTAEMGALQTERAALDETTKTLRAELEAALVARATLEREKEALEKRARRDVVVVEAAAAGSPVTDEDEEKAAALQALRELETRCAALQAEAGKVALLEGTIAALQGTASLVPGLRDQIERLNMHIHELNTRLSHHRPASRGSSRAPAKRRRSPSSQGLLFVRNPAEKGGQVYITTRAALRDREFD